MKKKPTRTTTTIFLEGAPTTRTTKHVHMAKIEGRTLLWIWFHRIFTSSLTYTLFCLNLPHDLNSNLLRILKTKPWWFLNFSLGSKNT